MCEIDTSTNTKPKPFHPKSLFKTKTKFSNIFQLSNTTCILVASVGNSARIHVSTLNMLTTQFVPISRLAAWVVPSIIATSVMYEYFRLSHDTVRTMQPDWIQATHDLAEHKDRQACSTPVVMDPVRRSREHEGRKWF